MTVIFSFFRGHSVVEIVHEEETEKDEKLPEVEESPEAAREGKKQEYIAKQKEMLQNEVSSEKYYCWKTKLIWFTSCSFSRLDWVK